MSLKKRKENKELPPRMNPMEERGHNNHLFVEAVPVRYCQNGKVSPVWLSACKEERTLTSHLMERIADSLNVTKACQRVVSNGGSSGVDGMKVEELKEWLGDNLITLQNNYLQARITRSQSKEWRYQNPMGAGAGWAYRR